MNVRTRNAGILLLSLLMIVGLSVSTAFAAGKTYTGTVSDAMCGAKHTGSAAECTRGCVSKGSKYALVVGDKVYTLETSDKAALAALDRGERDVLLLAALAGLGNQEIAGSLGIPYGTVCSRLSRARMRLRESLGGTNPADSHSPADIVRPAGGRKEQPKWMS